MKNKLLILLIIGVVTLTGCYTAADPAHVDLAADDRVIAMGATDTITYQPLQLDPTTHAAKTITYPHSEEHGGNAYFIAGNDDAMAIGDNFTILVETANTAKWMHLTFEAEGILAIHSYVYEGPFSIIATGAAVPAINRDRNSTNTAGGYFWENPTIAGDPTLIWQWHSGGRKEGGQASEGQELILKQHCFYLFVIESEVNNNAASGQLNWYEHSNKDA